jgi:hypothetical protein
MGDYEDKFWGAVGSLIIIVVVVGICVLVWMWLKAHFA